MTFSMQIAIGNVIVNAINSGRDFVKAYLKVNAQVNNIARNKHIPNDNVKSSANSIWT